jgi:hypothetical protein
LEQNIHIYQIFYDEISRVSIAPGFIPLDNSKNPRPDWFEFLPILNFLRNNQLDEDAWYGFLSPKFTSKTGYSSAYVINLLEKYGDIANVALFSPDWDQLSYFLNPWEQGEIWHPGIKSASQSFFKCQGVSIEIDGLVTDTTTSVFCNYIIAKKVFWSEWRALAELFFNYVEEGLFGNSLSNQNADYGSKERQYPIKTFIQERFASLILAKEKYKVIMPDQSISGPIFSKLFANDISTRRGLIACDLLKKRYREANDAEALRLYWKIREGIRYAAPNH